MKRPNKKDYLTINQFEYNQMLCKYYEALETYIDILEKQLTLTDVVDSDSEQLNVSKTNPNFEEWLQTHEKFKDNTYVWGMGYVMSYADMKAKHKDLKNLPIHVVMPSACNFYMAGNDTSGNCNNCGKPKYLH